MKKGGFVPMSKKNKHKDLSSMDQVTMEKFNTNLDKQYHEIVGDIEDIQYKIYLADKKKLRKQKKKMKKKGTIGFYEPKSKKVRIWASSELTSDKLFDTIKRILIDLRPIVVIISKLVMTLIVSILSLDIIKERIPQKALQRMDTLYKLCASVR